MSIIIRLQNLPWSASSADIRHYFKGLVIPEGGVHIIGGDKGNAFIGFNNDEDARQAMQKDGGKIKDARIKLFLSSRTEMQSVIEQVRKVSPDESSQGSTRHSSREGDRYKSDERTQRRGRSPIRNRRNPSPRYSGSHIQARSRSPRGIRDKDRDRGRESERHIDRSRRDDRGRGDHKSPARRQDENSRSHQSSTSKTEHRSRRSCSDSNIKEKLRTVTSSSDSASRDVVSSRNFQDTSHDTISQVNIQTDLASVLKQVADFNKYSEWQQNQSPEVKFIDSRNLYDRRSPAPEYHPTSISEIQNFSSKAKHAGEYDKYESCPEPPCPEPPFGNLRFTERMGPSFTDFASRRETDNSDIDTYGRKNMIENMIESRIQANSSEKCSSYNVPDNSVALADKYSHHNVSESYKSERQNYPSYGSNNAQYMEAKKELIQIDFEKFNPVRVIENEYSRNVRLSKDTTQKETGINPFISEQPNLSHNIGYSSDFRGNEHKATSQNDFYSWPSQQNREENYVSTANIGSSRHLDSFDDRRIPLSSQADAANFRSELEVRTDTNRQSREDRFGLDDPMFLSGKREALYNNPNPVSSAMLERSNFAAQVPSYYVAISGLSPAADFKEVQHVLRGTYAPRSAIRFSVDQHGHGTGTAYVKLNSEEDLNKTLIKHQTFIDGRAIEIYKCPEDIYNSAPPDDYQQQKPMFESSKYGYSHQEDLCVLLKGLPYSADENDVIYFFTGLNIEDIIIEYDSAGKAVGTGFVEFASSRDLQEAMSMSGRKIDHRYIEILPSSRRAMAAARRALGIDAKPKKSSHLPVASDQFRTGSERHSSKESFYRTGEKSFGDSTVHSPFPPRKRPLCALLSGLPPSITNSQITEFFSEAGLIPDAIHLILGENRQPSGRAFIEFLDPIDFDAALKRHNKCIGTNTISVKQVLYEEMVKILETRRAKHNFSGKSFGKFDSFSRSKSELPEKVPYLWEPPDTLNSEDLESGSRRKQLDPTEYDLYNSSFSNDARRWPSRNNPDHFQNPESRYDRNIPDYSNNMRQGIRVEERSHPYSEQYESSRAVFRRPSPSARDKHVYGSGSFHQNQNSFVEERNTQRYTNDAYPNTERRRPTNDDCESSNFQSRTYLGNTREHDQNYQMQMSSGNEQNRGNSRDFNASSSFNKNSGNKHGKHENYTDRQFSHHSIPGRDKSMEIDRPSPTHYVLDEDSRNRTPVKFEVKGRQSLTTNKKMDETFDRISSKTVEKRHDKLISSKLPNKGEHSVKSKGPNNKPENAKTKISENKESQGSETKNEKLDKTKNDTMKPNASDSKNQKLDKSKIDPKAQTSEKQKHSSDKISISSSKKNTSAKEEKPKETLKKDTTKEDKEKPKKNNKSQNEQSEKGKEHSASTKQKHDSSHIHQEKSLKSSSNAKVATKDNAEHRKSPTRKHQDDSSVNKQPVHKPSPAGNASTHPDSKYKSSRASSHRKPHDYQMLAKSGCLIQINNIPFETCVDEVLDFFRGYGLRSEDIFQRFTDFGEPTGEVRITFHNPQDAMRAMRLLNHQYFGGRLITMFPVDFF